MEMSDKRVLYKMGPSASSKGELQVFQGLMDLWEGDLVSPVGKALLVCLKVLGSRRIFISSWR